MPRILRENRGPQSQSGSEPLNPMKQPEEVKLSREEGDALIERIEASGLSEDDRRLVVKLIELWFWMSFALTEAKLSMKRLKRLLFGGARAGGKDKASPTPSTAAESDLSTGPSQCAALGQAQAENIPGQDEGSKETKKPPRGHGRKGVQEYTGATVVRCDHETLRAGERCPLCGRGNLYRLPPGVELQVDGHALLSALRYEREKLRCSGCGELFTAPLPPAVDAQKYTPQARAVVVLSRYYLGLPFNRLESFQAALGVPVADATLWALAEQVADCIYPVFDQL